jgi:hypothetical protein
LLWLVAMRRPLAAAALTSVPAFAAIALLAPVAAAQPGAAQPVPFVPAVPTAPPTYVAPPAAPPAEPELVGIRRRAAEDPAADRAYVARTALVAPRGTITLDVRAPTMPAALATLNVAVTDRIELGAGGAAVYMFDSGSDPLEGSLFALHGKVQLVKGRRAALAFGYDLIKTRDDDDDDTLYIPSLVASFCTDGDLCRTLLSVHLTGIGMDGEDEMPVFGGVSFVSGAKNRLVGEIHASRDDETGETIFGGYLGARFGGRKVAFDAGVAFGGVDESATTCDGCGGDDEGELGAFPFVGMSARL